MSRTPLRKYIRDIEGSIQNGNLDEALKHCWFILQTYPKHIQTYRLLGKILMEKRDYEDSYFVLNKVLEVFPDDFVAHIGLSFIAEVNNQLDSAVQHMEYAFELQPTNAMLKEELKRLHLKKDGIEPQTIRLTRGALINMYRRSGLYPQAIAELRIGLQTNPSRVDFKGYLAYALLQTGERIEAIQACIDMLGTSPFNFLANQIAFEVLPHTSDALDTEAFHQRLIDIDPYYMYVGDKIKTVEDVPDMAVNTDTYNGKNPEIDLNAIAWQETIAQYWEQASVWDTEKTIDSDIDWDSIIENRMAAPENEEMEEDALQSDAESAATGTVQVNQENEVEEILKNDPNLSGDFMASTEETVSDIPGWIFDDDEKNSSEKDLPTFKHPQDENIDTVENIDQLERDETGMVDNEVPTISDPESETISKHWVKIETESSPLQKSHLEDTQKIVLHEAQDDSLRSARKAIDEKNFEDAILKLDDLVENEYHLEEIIRLIENTQALLTQGSDAWFILGKAYLKTDQKEKALQAFHNAEKNTTI